MIVAPVVAGGEASLRTLLATMNRAPGVVDAHNALVPFAEFGTLHFARFVLLTDGNHEDLEPYGIVPPSRAAYLAFMGDCDGPADETLAAITHRCAPGLARLFAHCVDYDPGAGRVGLLSWLRARDQPVAALYVNTIGRTVRDALEESALQRALAARVPRVPLADGDDVQRLRDELLAFVRDEVRAGRLVLTPRADTPIGWRLRNLVHLVGVPLAGLALLPFLVVLSPLLVVLLRYHETHDAELTLHPDPAKLAVLQAREDRDVTNPFTAFGFVKPGPFRRWTLTALLALLNYACRHVFNAGYLTRVQTIHFARWAFLDDRHRVVFCSNYDGSLEAYMDDFINKVAWGLNLVFSNGAGYPKTDWLVCGGARREQRFKGFLRRHELPTDVWYKAYPGLTAVDLARNHRIREGVDRSRVSDAEANAWLALL